ncbi:hypothetical protein CEXT_468391 [Caerostris extrusa]|uniref:Uncharacterized protein n=1 Tax=Caerostris extrusa TaxID=172846 RepID=A0AAV4W5S9_CAEEX|nr:hypothetical protein CEXT_468391 [Caerostris extrusa]
MPRQVGGILQSGLLKRDTAAQKIQIQGDRCITSKARNPYGKKNIVVGNLTALSTVKVSCAAKRYGSHQLREKKRNGPLYSSPSDKWSVCSERVSKIACHE